MDLLHKLEEPTFALEGLLGLKDESGGVGIFGGEGRGFEGRQWRRDCLAFGVFVKGLSLGVVAY